MSIKINRLLDVFARTKHKSAFLFGPRSVGKTFWIKNNLPSHALYINLSKADEFMMLSTQPELIRSMCKGKNLVVIDEIQKIPVLLDEVQNLIEESDIRFLLTGSSARKLKKGHTNLLGGRAQVLNLYPFCSQELGQFDLNKYLNFGGLPRVYLSENPQIEFDPYLELYLEQEIQLESHLRNLQPFSRFLKVAALSNAQLMAYQSIANDVGLSPPTIAEYYRILEDTLIGYRLEPWLESKKRKAIQTAKFYFFDVGVNHFICGRKFIAPKTKEWGDAFEHFIALELRAWAMYSGTRSKINFWRNQSKHEVDFIVNDEVGIEVKATSRVTSKHLNSMKALQEEKITRRHIVVSLEPIPRTENGIEILPWQIFLTQLWANDLIKGDAN